MLLIKDDVAAAQLYHSLRSPRWYRWPLICLSETGLFALPFLGVACRSNGSGPLALAEDAWGSWGLGLVSVLKMFLIASCPPLFFAFNGHSRFCAINHIDANNRGILCFGKN